MKKFIKFGSILMSLLIIFSIAIFCDESKEIKTSTDNTKQQNNKQELKNINMKGVILPTDREMKDFIFEDTNSGNIYELEKSEQNKKVIKEYINKHIVINGDYKRVRDTLENGFPTTKRILVIKEAKLILNDIEVSGYLSVKGNPRKLILTDSENIYYEIEKDQENYQKYITDYQGYYVKITGQYYLLIFSTIDGSKIEKKVLLVEKIEKLEE